MEKIFVNNPWINQNTIEDRDYQRNIVSSAINSNTLVVLPTGLGKTSIAALVVAHCLEKNPEKNILFLAPTRPLVHQHFQNFEKFLKIGVEMKIITGEHKPSERGKIYKGANIIFATPQTIRNDIQTDIIDLKNFSLCIFDEAHRAVGNYAYPYVARKFTQEAKGLILALTASPGSAASKIAEVKKELFIDNIEIKSREDGDVSKYVQKLDQEWIEVELTPPLKAIREYLEKCRDPKMKKLLNWGIIRSSMMRKADMIKLQQNLANKKTGINMAAMSQLAEVMKIDHALILLETQCLHSLNEYFLRLEEKKEETRAVTRLMNDENFLSAMRLTKELIKEGKEHPKIEKLKELIERELKENKDAGIMVFAQFRDTITQINDTLKNVKNAAPVEFIGQAKKYGKGLKQKEQVQILNEFKLGFYNILVASQIGEEGLDIEETDMVIFYEPVPSAVRRIQRTGRTARTKEGKVVILMTKNTRDEAYHWSAFQKEKTMKKILYSMQNKQKQEQRSVKEF